MPVNGKIIYVSNVLRAKKNEIKEMSRILKSRHMFDIIGIKSILELTKIETINLNYFTARMRDNTLLIYFEQPVKDKYEKKIVSRRNDMLGWETQAAYKPCLRTRNR